MYEMGCAGAMVCLCARELSASASEGYAPHALHALDMNGVQASLCDIDIEGGWKRRARVWGWE